MTLSGVGGVMTGLGLIALLIGEWRDRPDVRVVGKPLASIGFVVGAIGAGASGAPWMIPAGAVMFTTSDIAVVRDRFVSPGFVNRIWGLPLYYASQWILAWSITAMNG